MIWFDRDLFDIGIAIHDIDNDVADRTVSLVDSDPAPTTDCVVGQDVDRERSTSARRNSTLRTTRIADEGVLYSTHVSQNELSSASPSEKPESARKEKCSLTICRQSDEEIFII